MNLPGQLSKFGEFGNCPKHNSKRPGIARPFLFRNEIHYRLPKFGQPTVKKMFALLYDEQLRSRLEAIHPFHSLLDIDKLILVTLHDQPGTLWLRFEAGCETTDRGRHADQPVNFGFYRRFHTDSCTEGKAGKPQWVGSVPRTHPFDGRKRVVELTNTLIVFAFALLGSPKVETQSLISRAHESARQGMCNLVMHGATVLRMWVANYGATLQRTFTGSLDNSLEPTNRAIDKQSFSHGMLAHCEYRGG